MSHRIVPETTGSHFENKCVLTAFSDRGIVTLGHNKNREKMWKMRKAYALECAENRIRAKEMGGYKRRKELEKQ